MKGLMNAFLSLYFLPSLSFFWFSARPGSQTLDFPLYTGCIISPKCVLESHDNCIFWNVRVCICISVHYFWLFLFLFRMCVGLQWSLSSRARRRHQTPRRVNELSHSSTVFPCLHHELLIVEKTVWKLFKCWTLKQTLSHHFHSSSHIFQ